MTFFNRRIVGYHWSASDKSSLIIEDGKVVRWIGHPIYKNHRWRKWVINQIMKRRKW